MKARAAAFLRSVAARLDPPRSMADECEAMRRELEAEAAAEFGVRHLPDPASPGDVWPPTTYTRRLKAVK